MGKAVRGESRNGTEGEWPKAERGKQSATSSCRAGRANRDWRHRLASRRKRRVDDSEPILPRRAESGSTAKKPSRMSDAALSPLAANSGSPAAISSSKSATRCWSWVLMPQTGKSPNGGRRRRRTTGRFYVWPSAWGSGAKARSPSFTGGDRRRCIPARRRRRPWPTGRLKIATSHGGHYPAATPQPSNARCGRAGRVRRTGPSRRQNEQLAPQLSLRRILAEISSAGNRDSC